MSARPTPARRQSSFDPPVKACDTTFTFGQRGNHFFQCPSRRDYTRLPHKLAALLSSAEIKKIHHVTLGYENSFLLTWRDHRGSDHIDSQGLPTELIDFIYTTTPQKTLARSVPNIRLTLGPYNSSFFVTDGNSYLWMNLPPDLLAALQLRIRNGAWIDRPRLVTLGADSSFLLMTEKNAAVWDLGHYALLSKMLEFSKTQRNGIEEVKNVSLHCYRYQCFVAESWNGTLLHHNLPPHELGGVELIRQAILKGVQDTSRLALDREQEMKRLKDRDRDKRRPNLSEQTSSFRRELEDRTQEFTAKTKGKGLRMSLRMSVSAKGIAAGMGFG